MAVIFAGISSGATAGDTTDGAADRMLEINPRYYSWMVEPGREWTELNTGYGYADWEVPLERSALVLVDVWQFMYLKDTESRNDRIIREKIVPLLEAARRAGLTIIHCPGPRIGADLPGVQRYPEAEGEPTRDEWPPLDFRRRKGEFSKFRNPPAPASRTVELREMQARQHIHDAVAPLPGEPVLLTGAELHEYLREHGKLFLFYAGFQTNACLFIRNYGVWEMHKRGYCTIILRDCGTAMESFETQAELQQTKNAVLMLEMFGRYSLTSAELIKALEEL